jgi:hypothetical protein
MGCACLYLYARIRKACVYLLNYLVLLSHLAVFNPVTSGPSIRHQTVVLPDRISTGALMMLVSSAGKC